MSTAVNHFKLYDSLSYAGYSVVILSMCFVAGIIANYVLFYDGTSRNTATWPLRRADLSDYFRQISQQEAKLSLG